MDEKDTQSRSLGRMLLLKLALSYGLTELLRSLRLSHSLNFHQVLVCNISHFAFRISILPFRFLAAHAAKITALWAGDGGRAKNLYAD